MREARIDLALYLTGAGAWFAAMGVQTVLFAWLVTVQLHETPEKVGFALSMMSLPTLFLLLLGGAAADRYGGARMASIAQAISVLPVCGLALLIAADLLVYVLLIIYALLIGTVAAFVTPARDGLLSQIAGPRIQRTVVLASLVQFGVQILGFQVAGLADVLGPVFVLSTQIAMLALGALCLRALDGRLTRRAEGALEDALEGASMNAAESAVASAAASARPSLAGAIGEGLRAVLASEAMRNVALINILIGLFFMGAFQVGIPLLVRELHGGTPGQLAQVNTVHMIGVVATTLVLLRLGDVERRGRALLTGVLGGAGALVGIGCSTSFTALLICNFCWGIAGGVVMSMARTIMQEAAPPALRGRVMAFFSLTFMGAGPLGALLSGFLVQGVGVQQALVLPALLVAGCALLVMLRSSLWRLAPAPV